MSVVIKCQANQVSLLVGNPGAGIEPQHLSHLFERFYRVDTSHSRAEGSTGLGLAIVRSIMSLHQGKAEVESLPGSMTVFSLNFPNLDGQPPGSRRESLRGKLLR